MLCAGSFRPSPMVACTVLLMQQFLRDRKFAKSTTITQSAEDPRYRKLNTRDFILDRRTHNPVRLIKPSKVAGVVANQLIKKFNWPSQVSKQGAVLFHQLKLCMPGPHLSRVDGPRRKFELAVSRLWRSAAWPHSRGSVVGLQSLETDQKSNHAFCPQLDQHLGAGI